MAAYAFSAQCCHILTRRGRWDVTDIDFHLVGAARRHRCGPHPHGLVPDFNLMLGHDCRGGPLRSCGDRGACTTAACPRPPSTNSMRSQRSCCPCTSAKWTAQMHAGSGPSCARRHWLTCPAPSFWERRRRGDQFQLARRATRALVLSQQHLSRSTLRERAQRSCARR